MLPLKNTRRANDLTYLSSHSLEKLHYKNQCFRQLAPKLWNNLDRKIRECESINEFKIKLKSYFFQLWLAQK